MVKWKQQGDVKALSVLHFESELAHLSKDINEIN